MSTENEYAFGCTRDTQTVVLAPFGKSDWRGVSLAELIRFLFDHVPTATIDDFGVALAARAGLPAHKVQSALHALIGGE